MARVSRMSMVGWHTGMDSVEIREYLYQYGRSRIPMFAIGDTYYVAAKLNEKLPAGYDWVYVPDSFVEAKSQWKIFAATVKTCA